MSRKGAAYGFLADAKKLVSAFAAENSGCDIAVFADVWKNQKFSSIFLGRPNVKELVEFCGQILHLTMELFYKSSADETKAGYLFLLYGLVRYQPLKPPMKARITLEIWEHIKKLRNDAETKRNKSVLYVIRYLVHNGFDFVAALTLMGPFLSCEATEISGDLKVNLLNEESEEKFDEKCYKIQEDLEKCFQELKLQRAQLQESMKNRLGTLSSTIDNAPFSEFLGALDPPVPSTRSSTEQASGIGQRRALLKAAAYSKVIEKAVRVSKEGKTAPKKRGRPRKSLIKEQPEEVKNEVERELVSEPSVSKPKQNIPERNTVAKKRGRPRKSPIVEEP